MKPPPILDTAAGRRVEGSVVTVLISFCTLQLELIEAKKDT